MKKKNKKNQFFNQLKYDCGRLAYGLLQHAGGKIIQILGLSILLSIPILLNMYSINLSPKKSWLHQPSSFQIFLKPQTSQSHISTIIGDLKSFDDISSIDYISAEKGLRDFSKFMNVSFNMSDNENPIPALIQTQITKPELHRSMIDALIQQLKKNPSVAQVNFDSTAAERLSYFSTMLERSTMILGALFFFLFISMVQRLMHQLLREQSQYFQVLYLTGASKKRMSRPFQYLGMVFGMLAATLSILIALAIWYALLPNLDGFIQSYDPSWQAVTISLKHILYYIGFGAVLGLITASWSCRHIEKNWESF